VACNSVRLAGLQREIWKEKANSSNWNLIADEFEDYGFNGNLDGIRIWNRAWTDEEVAQNYETVTFYPPGAGNTINSESGWEVDRLSHSGTPYQLGAWDFETGSGLTVPDLTGNGCDFLPLLSGTATAPTAAKLFFLAQVGCHHLWTHRLW